MRHVQTLRAAEGLAKRASARAAAMASKDRGIYRNLKRGMYTETLTLLESGEADFSFIGG